MKILLFGKNGQVGRELQCTLAPLGEVLAVDYPEVDFLDLKGLRDFTLEVAPDLIVNAAAYTAVDKAEIEPEIALTINGEAPGVLAEVAKMLNAGLVHYSTDYVFDGQKGEPYTEEDEPNPINVYGDTKLTGDVAIQDSGCAHLILRTSWIYGTRGNNFFRTIIHLAKEKEQIKVVNDQVGCPTWCRSVAGVTTQVLHMFIQNTKGSMTGPMLTGGGLFNYCSDGLASWFDFASAILAEDKKYSRQKYSTIMPVTSLEYLTTAKRPSYTVLNTSLIRSHFNLEVQSWQEQLGACWEEYKSRSDG